MNQKVPAWIVALLVGTTLLTSCTAFLGNRNNMTHSPSTLSAQAYLRFAAATTGIEKQQYLLQAADRFIQDRNLTAAQNILNKINDTLSPEVRAEKQILQAQLQLSIHEPNQALTLLNQAEAYHANLPTDRS